MYKKEYYEKNKEKFKEYKQRWREKNKDKCNKKQREYMRKYLKDENNKEKINAYRREWEKNKRQKDKENAKLVIKQKEVLDKIRETLRNSPNKEDDYDYINLKYEIYKLYKLLEEIE